MGSGPADGQPPAIPPPGETGNRYDRWSTVARPRSKDAKVYSESSGAEKMTKFVALIEKTNTGYSAHVPDLPGCIAAAETYDEIVTLIHDAIEFHIEGMLLHGEQVPEPTTLAELVEVG
jgi:predicted RNase H-like HicB family nuclease